MMNQNNTRGFRQKALICTLCGAVFYVLMLTVTLAHLESMTGHVPFDMRPTGYDAKDAAELLSALGDSGRRYYLTRQVPLDMVYPALLGLTLVFTLQWLGRGYISAGLLRVGVIVAISAAACEYAENTGIVVMILNWPTLSHHLVTATSIASVLKAVLTTFAVLFVLFAAGRRLRPHSAEFGT